MKLPIHIALRFAVITTLLLGSAAWTPVRGALLIVLNTNDSGAGSLRQAILTANSTVNVPDLIHFNIGGDGPHTISPITPLPAVTDPAVIDGYSQSGSSANTLSGGDNAILKILLQESLVIDTTNSAVRGLAIRQIQIGAAPGPKGSNVIEGCFIGLDTSGTNSLASLGFGVFVQTPNNRVGGTNAFSRNVISGKGATGIEIFESFASNNVVQGNFIGTDRHGTSAIGNVDRALVINMNASAAIIGGSGPGAGNVISGNLNRGITLDGSNNLVEGNLIGTAIDGQPLGNARSGIEIGGSGNTVGGLGSGSRNVIAYNGVDGGGVFTTNGVDVKAGTTLYAILGNSIFDNQGLGIDVNADGVVTPGFPVITLASNTLTATIIRGSNTPNASFRLELFANLTADKSGFGEGKTLLISTNIATDGGGSFTVNWPTQLPPGLFVTATGNGRSEFSQARMIVAAGLTNSWTNSASGKWETAANWSLNVPPFAAHHVVLITNAGSKTVQSDATTANNFPSTLTVSNLVISAPGGAINTLALSHGGILTPLRVLRSLSISNGGAVVINNAAVNLEGPPSTSSRCDGALVLNEGSFTATNSSQFYIGSSGSGSLTVSNGIFRAYYPIVGINPGASGIWNIAGGTNIVTQVFDVGDSLTATGTVKVTGGLLTTPTIYVGLFGNGSLIVSNGTFQCASQVDVASQPGSQGTFIAAGNGVCTVGSIIVSEGPGATGRVVVADSALLQVNSTLENRSGTVRMDGGLLVTSNLLMLNTNGQFIFNRGRLQTRAATVTNGLFVVGDSTSPAVYQLLSTAGRSNVFTRGLRIATNATLTGNGIVTANITNFGIIAPGDSAGRLDLHGNVGMSNSADLRIELGGYTPETQFDFVRAIGNVVLGGKLSVSFINNFARTVTNGAGFMVLTNSLALNGAFTNVASGGLITTTDGYARFTAVYSASTSLRLTNLVIVDTDGDGLPDWYEDQFGLNKNFNDAALDLDGDGATNMDEFNAGTAPNNPSSVLRIVALQREAGNIRIIWSTVGGKSYQVETNAVTAQGGITPTFVAVSPLIAVGGAGAATTNYLHTGGYNPNFPARYYRVRLGP